MRQKNGIKLFMCTSWVNVMNRMGHDTVQFLYVENGTMMGGGLLTQVVIHEYFAYGG